MIPILKVFSLGRSDQNNTCICHICGNSSDNIKTFGRDGKPFIEYVACKNFVKMKPCERDKILFKKRGLQQMSKIWCQVER